MAQLMNDEFAKSQQLTLRLVQIVFAHKFGTSANECLKDVFGFIPGLGCDVRGHIFEHVR